ncbi:hypothetical protein JW921_01770, partial [Candidatus Fermentibacterales bacterium]|nr:hypothetical protein [Candidatus Fermentibacterales bacterium]
MTLTSCLALLSVASCAALAQNAAGGPPPPSPVIYYAFVETDGEELPEGSVVVLEDILVLAPMESLEQIEQAPEARLEAALNAMIQDEGNAWTGEDLRVESVSLRDGHAEIELEGAIFGAGGIVLVAARTQI